MARMTWVVVLAIASVACGGEPFEDPKVQEQVRVCTVSIAERLKIAEKNLTKSIGQQVTIDTKTGPRTGELTKVGAQIVLSVKLIVNRRVLGTSTMKILWADVTLAQIDKLDDGWDPKSGAAALHAYRRGNYQQALALVGDDVLSKALVLRINEARTEATVASLWKSVCGKATKKTMATLAQLLGQHSKTAFVVENREAIESELARQKKVIGVARAKQLNALRKRSVRIKNLQPVLSPDFPVADAGWLRQSVSRQKFTYLGHGPIVLELERPTLMVRIVYGDALVWLSPKYTIELSGDMKKWMEVAVVDGFGVKNRTTISSPDRPLHDIILEKPFLAKYVRVKSSKSPLSADVFELYGVTR